MNELLENFKKDIVSSIRLIVPPDEVAFIESMDYVFAPFPEDIMQFIEHNTFPFRFLDITPFK